MNIINNIDQSSFLGIPWQMLEAPLCADDVLDWNYPNSAERRASLWEPRKSKLQPSEFKRRKLAWFGRGLKSLFLIAVSWRKTHWFTELMLHCFLKAESARSAYNFGPKWNMMNPDLLGMIWMFAASWIWCGSKGTGTIRFRHHHKVQTPITRRNARTTSRNLIKMCNSTCCAHGL